MTAQRPKSSRPSSRPLSSSDALYADVIRGLYEGRFIAGQRLLEPDLMRQYGIGRGSVREALKRLAAEGVVVSHPHRGAQIRHLARREALNALLVLERLIGLAARQAAAAVADGQDAAHFERALEAVLKHETLPDSYEFMRARNRLYRAMLDLAGNAELSRLLPSLNVNLIRAQTRTPDGTTRFADYRAMGSAIASARPETAETAARAHVLNIASAVQTLPQSFFAPDPDTRDADG